MLEQILLRLDSQVSAFEKLEQVSVDKDAALSSMEIEMNTKIAEYQCLLERHTELDSQLNQTLSALTTEQDAVVESLEKIKDLKETIGLLESNVLHLQSQVEDKEVLIAEAKAQLTQMEDSSRVSLEQERNAKNEEISILSKNFESRLLEIESAKNELLEKEQLIMTLNAELAMHLSLKETTQDDQSAFLTQITSLEEQIKLKTDTITGFEHALLQAQEYMDEKESLAVQKEAEVLTLQEAISKVRAFSRPFMILESSSTGKPDDRIVRNKGSTSLLAIFLWKTGRIIEQLKM